MSKCSGITQSGTACKGIPIDGSSYCYVHHPDHTEERRRHGKKGGKRGGRGRPQAELATIKERLSTLADDVLGGRVDRGDAAVASQVLNVYLRAVSVELKAKEQQDVLERIEELEALLERQNERRGYGAARYRLRKLQKATERDMVTIELKDGSTARFYQDEMLECFMHETERGRRHYFGEEPGPAHPVIVALRNAREGELERLVPTEGTFLALLVGEDAIVRGERERPGRPVVETSPGVYE